MKKLFLSIIVSSFCNMHAMMDGWHFSPETEIVLGGRAQCHEIVSEKAEATPLHSACIKGNIERVKEEIALPGCRINKRGRIVIDQKEMIGTPLFFASKYGHSNIVQLLLGIQASDIDKHDYYYDEGAPLHVAATPEIVQHLLDYSADQESTTNKSYRTPLIIQTIKGNKDVVKYLIDHRANIYHTDCYNNNALVYALRSPHSRATHSIIKKLVKQDGYESQTILIHAVARILESGDSHAISQLHEHSSFLEGLNFYIFPFFTFGHVVNSPAFFLQDDAAVLKKLYAPLAHKEYELTSLEAQDFCLSLEKIRTVFTCCERRDNHKNSKAAYIHGRLFLHNADFDNLYRLYGNKSIAYARTLVFLNDLFWHIKKGNADEVKQLLNKRPKHIITTPLNSLRFCGDTIMEYVSQYNSSDVCAVVSRFIQK